MKRKYKQKAEYLYRMLFANIFWKSCCICKDEFKFQRAWRFLAGPYYNDAGHWRYICLDCAPNKDTANDIVLSGKWRGERPVPPKSR